MSSPVEALVNREYKYGFVTDIEADSIPKGLSEDVVRLISEKKGEPAWLLEWRLKAYRYWAKLAKAEAVKLLLTWPSICLYRSLCINLAMPLRIRTAYMVNGSISYPPSRVKRHLR